MPAIDGYLRCAHLVREQLAAPEVRLSWDSPSVLAQWTVAGLAGHLARSVLLLPGIVAAQVDDGDPLVSAVEYFVSALPDADLHSGSQIAVEVRERGLEAAGSGVEDLLTRVDVVIGDLETDLRARPEGHVITALGMRLTLRDYLMTRLVEMTVHADDLAVSVSAPAPSFPAEVEQMVVSTLALIALRRRGFPAVVRGLARAERAPGVITAF